MGGPFRSQEPAPELGTDPNDPIPAGGVQDEEKLIGGFPLDYAGPDPARLGGYIDRNGRWRQGQPPGPYRPSDEWLPSLLSEAEVRRIQEKLVAAGVLKVTDVRYGLWDDKTANVYRTVLAAANATGRAAADQLEDWVQNPRIQATKEKQQTIFEVSNPLDIKQGYESTALELTGRGPSDEAAFVQHYQGEELAAQRQKAGLEEANEGGTVVVPPNLDASSEEYLKTHHGMDVQAFGAASRMMEFYEMIG